jgi:hypothetical protein
MTQFIPPGVNDTIIAPFLNLSSNKDFAGRPIVPRSMENLPPRDQYDANTSLIARHIGDLLNWSPKQIDYVIRSYTGGVGKTVLPAFTGGKTSIQDRLYMAFVKPWLSLMIADPDFSNQKTQDFYDLLTEATQLSAHKNKDEKIESGANTPEERAASILSKASEKLSDLRKQEQALLEQEMSVFDREKKVKELRRQATQIAEDAINAYQVGGGSKTIYPPGVDDQKRDAYDKIVNESKNGIPEKTMQEIFAMFAQLKPKPGNVAVYAGDRKTALAKWVSSGKLTAEQYRTFIKYYYPND